MVEGSSPRRRYLKVHHEDDSDIDVSYSEWLGGRNVRSVAFLRDGRVAATDDPFAVINTSVGPVAILSDLPLGDGAVEEGEEEISEEVFAKAWTEAKSRTQASWVPS